MGKPKDEHIIIELRDELKKRFPKFIGLYFFGSRVKGDYQDDSDIDVVILFEDITHDERLEIYGFISKIEHQHGIFLDTKIMTTSIFNYNIFFYEEVKKTGIYYAA